MGFQRQQQPGPPPAIISLNEAAIEDEIDRLIGLAMPPRDPFDVADRCPLNATGHNPHASCGEVVCVHCSKVIW